MTDDDDTSRRRLLVLLAALGAAGAGAGLGRFTGLVDDSSGGGDGLDLSVDQTATTPDPDGGGAPADSDEGTPDGTPTGTAVPAGAGAARDDDGFTDDWVVDDDDGSGGAPAPSTGPNGDRGVTASTSPVTVTNVSPGDDGRVSVTLTLSGGSARLWVRGDASSFAERGLTEPELAAGDDAAAGELQEEVHIELRYESPAGERLIHEGSLASLRTLSEWEPLTADCVEPGSYRLDLRWSLPVDAAASVQSDSARFTLGFAAESCPTDGG